MAATASTASRKPSDRPARPQDRRSASRAPSTVNSAMSAPAAKIFSPPLDHDGAGRILGEARGPPRRVAEELGRQGVRPSADPSRTTATPSSPRSTVDVGRVSRARPPPRKSALARTPANTRLRGCPGVGGGRPPASRGHGRTRRRPPARARRSHRCRGDDRPQLVGEPAPRRRLAPSPEASRWASVSSHRRPQAGIPVSLDRGPGDDRRAPAVGRHLVMSSICSNSRRRRLGARPVGLVDHEDVGDLHRPALFACTASPQPGLTTTTVVSAVPDDLHLDLADPDGLDHDERDPDGVEHTDGLRRRPATARRAGHGSPSTGCRPRRRRRALHPHAVTQDGAARER